MAAKPEIKRVLELAYRDYHCHFHREKDPVSLVHRYPDIRDQECAAFFAALLSYGNVATILSSVGKVLKVFEESPYQSLLNGKDFSFSGFRHRFTTGDDIEILSYWTQSALRSHGNLENFFLGEQKKNLPMKELLSSFVERFTSQPTPPHLGLKLKRRIRNLKYLISDPKRGSACKRLNMYLRWMVRPPDGIDLGLWKGLGSHQLMLPVDTHVLKTLHGLGWTKSQQATWKVVEAATEKLRLYFPSDPIRYDFALCHLSMAGKSIRAYAKME